MLAPVGGCWAHAWHAVVETAGRRPARAAVHLRGGGETDQYVLDPERKAITLTTFRKRRQSERGEILRARRAQAAYQSARAATKGARKKRK